VKVFVARRRYQKNMFRYIEGYVQKVNPQKTPQVRGATGRAMAGPAAGAIACAASWRHRLCLTGQTASASFSAWAALTHARR
jgi:hypothetical protein